MPVFCFVTAMGDLEEAIEYRTLDDISGARHEATRILGQVIFSVLADFWAEGECVVSVFDSEGGKLFTVEARTGETAFLTGDARSSTVPVAY